MAGLIAIIVLLSQSASRSILFAATIERILGVTGRIVVSRLLGLILAALAVQFVADGDKAIVFEGRGSGDVKRSIQAQY